MYNLNVYISIRCIRCFLSFMQQNRAVEQRCELLRPLEQKQVEAACLRIIELFVTAPH